MPLDFTGYVPGIPNMGPKYVPPTTMQIIEALQTEIKALKRVIETLAPETEVTALSDAIDALDGRLDAVELTLPDKEDVSNKVTSISLDSTDTEYPSAKCVYQTAKALQNDIDNKADGYTIGKAAKMTAAIPYGECDATSTSTAFTTTVPGIRELVSGACCLLKNGVVTSASGCTLNVNGLGAKPIYQSMAAASAVTTVFNVNYTMLFVYDATDDRVAGGCWIIYYGYNSNDNTIAYSVRNSQTTQVAHSSIYRYLVCFTDRDGKLVPACNTSNSTATNKNLTTTAFDPFAPIWYYSATGTVSTGATPAVASTWIKYVANLRYGFNCSSTQLTQKAPLYVRLTPQADALAKLDGNQCLVQSLPSAYDGKLYLLLGYTYSPYQVEMLEQHPIYYYDNNTNSIQIWHGQTI